MHDPRPYDEIVDEFYVNFYNNAPNSIWHFYKSSSFVYDRFFCYSSIIGKIVEKNNGDCVVLLSDSSHSKMHRGIFISLLNRYSPVVTIKVPMIENTRDVDLNIAIKTLSDRLLSLTKLDKFNLKRNRVAFCKAFEALSLIDFHLQEVPLIYAFRKTYRTIINH